jgi:hypothetical protein
MAIGGTLRLKLPQTMQREFLSICPKFQHQHSLPYFLSINKIRLAFYQQMPSFPHCSLSANNARSFSSSPFTEISEREREKVSLYIAIPEKKRNNARIKI